MKMRIKELKIIIRKLLRKKNAYKHVTKIYKICLLDIKTTKKSSEIWFSEDFNSNLFCNNYFTVFM